MEKRFINSALVYAVLAMIAGVFYREFTKFYSFTGKTNLAVMHTHYFLLGMFIFLFFALLERNGLFPHQKHTNAIVIIYHIGINITSLGFLLRGLNQVWETNLSTAMDASISGIAGIGHIIFGVSLILLLLGIRRQAASSAH